MKVLVLTNLYPNPLQPGRASWNRHQFRALAARRPVEVIAPVLWTDERACYGRRGGRRTWQRNVTTDGIPVEHPVYYYPPRMLRGQYGRFFQWSVQESFYRVTRRFRPDVVLASWAYPDGWAAVRLARRQGLPVVVKVHGSDVLSLDEYPGRRRATLETLRGADGIVSVSRDLAERITAFGVPDDRVAVIYNGIDTRLFSPGSQAEARRRLRLTEDTPLILFVGNLVPVKQVDVLIYACEQLALSGHKFQCRIVGDGPLRAALEARVAQSPAADRLAFVGARPQDELPDWYRAASVLALPSRSEGIPNVLSEAAACGTPFVAYGVGGIPEIAAQAAGRLVPAGNAAAFTDALLPAVEAHAKLARPAASAARSWEESASELDAFLTRVFSNHKKQPGIGSPGPFVQDAS